MTATQTALSHDAPGNYSTHAIEFLLETRRRMIAAKHPFLKFGIELILANLLSNAVKFILPENGNLFEEHDYRPQYFDLLKLPFPVCALEFSASDELYNPDSGLFPSKRRIALIFDPIALPAEIKKGLFRVAGMADDPAFEPGSIAVMSFYETEGMWGNSGGFLLIDPVESRPISAEEAKKSNLNPNELAKQLGRRNTQYGMPVDIYPFWPVFDTMRADRQQVLQNVVIDTTDEMRAAWQFMTAINCSNVETRKIKPSEALNKKRAKKGKAPLFEYHVLEVQASDPTANRKEREVKSGSGAHASPRTHLRRGHIRRLGEKSGNRTIWVNAAVVRPGAREGQVEKVYKVTPLES